MKTQNKNGHSELPWKVNTTFHSSLGSVSTIVQVNDEKWPVLTNRGDLETKANAEFIVKACNSHYAFVELLKCAKKLVKDDYNDYDGNFKRLEQAIKTAEGE